jgi:transcriptional antiterminator RfaH
MTSLQSADLSPSQPVPWAVVYTQPHAELLALKNLERQHYVTYCPMIRRRRSHARRVSQVLRPLFSNYVFVQIDPQRERWRPILSTYGVRSVVQAGDRLGTLDDAFVQSLKAREVDGVVTRPAQPYRPGQAVRLVDSAFEGIIATILTMDDKDRLVVLFDLLNRPVRARVRAEQVRAA